MRTAWMLALSLVVAPAGMLPAQAIARVRARSLMVKRSSSAGISLLSENELRDRFSSADGTITLDWSPAQRDRGASLSVPVSIPAVDPPAGIVVDLRMPEPATGPPSLTRAEDRVER